MFLCGQNVCTRTPQSVLTQCPPILKAYLRQQTLNGCDSALTKRHDNTHGTANPLPQPLRPELGRVRWKNRLSIVSVFLCWLVGAQAKHCRQVKEQTNGKKHLSCRRLRTTEKQCPIRAPSLCRTGSRGREATGSSYPQKNVVFIVAIVKSYVLKRVIEVELMVDRWLESRCSCCQAHQI